MARAAFPSGRKSLLLLALAAAIIGGAWWWQRQPPEPVYHGERLSQWLAQQYETYPMAITPEALHAFGPGTVAWLAYAAEYGRHPFKKHGPLPFDNAPQWLRKLVHAKWGGLRAWTPFDERRDALFALSALGPEAVPAIPALARILGSERERDDDGFLCTVAEALHATGPASWPVVEQTMQHGNQQARCAVINAIDGRLGSFAHPASEAEVAKVVNTLVKACRDPDATVRKSAEDGIGNSQAVRPDLIGADPLLNALINLLSDLDKDVRIGAMKTLGFYRIKAAPAIPRLIELLDDEDVTIRIIAAAHLAHIDTVEKRSAARLRIMARDDAFGGCRSTAALALEALGLSQDDKSATREALPGQ